MTFQSKNDKIDEFSPIDLPPDFPVSEPDFNLRGEISPIAPHVHDCFELGYCYEGSGIFLVENKILPFQAGNASVVNQHELHVMKGQKDSPAKWAFINLRPAKMLAEYVCEEEHFLNTENLCGPDFCNIIDHTQQADICETIRVIIDEINSKRDGYRSMVRALVWSLLVKLHRNLPEDISQETLSRKKLARIKPALGYILANYEKALSVEFLASRCNTSIANFRKIFHKAVGMSPQDYIKKLRMKAASVMLTTTNKSINEIAIESGYPTLSNFNRHFKLTFNKSPREYRIDN